MTTESARTLPCALAIGGLDPGGGAGIAADLRSFHAGSVFGCAVVAVVTVQSTDGLVSSRPVSARLILEQAKEVVRAQTVRAIKLGALGSESNVRAIAKWLGTLERMPVVLDPVMLPTRGGARLLSNTATDAMRDLLLRRATLVTANASEAEALTGGRVRTVVDATRAARALVAMGARAALVKGGHLTTRGQMIDVIAFEDGEIARLRGPRIALAPTHGGGCVLASLIAAGFARQPQMNPTRASIEAIVASARRVHQRALRTAVDVGGALRVLVPSS